MMAVRVLFAAGAARWTDYEAPLRRAFAGVGLDADLACETSEPGDVQYIIHAPGGDVKDFSPFTGLRAVLNLWAGVEGVIGNPTLKAPLVRMVDPGLTEGMTEYVVGHVLRHHLGIDAHLARQDGVWRNAEVPPLARDRGVGVLGLGVLGGAAAQALAGLNFRVLGWSRRPKQIAGIAFHHGEEGLADVLRQAEILVTLLPHTADTENLLDARRLALLPPGAVVVNPGRGALIDDAALLAALESGALGHATLDVFRAEPLPPEHPFWAHPKVTVTPHVAAETRPESAARQIAESIRRAEAGEPLAHVADPGAGY